MANLSFAPPPVGARFRGGVRRSAVDSRVSFDYLPPLTSNRKLSVMKVRSSLKSLKNRHKDCRVVRRKGRVYVINKTQRRFKAKQA